MYPIFCAEDTHIIPSYQATEVKTNTTISIDKGHIGVVISDSFFMNTTPIQLHSQILREGDSELVTLVSIQSNTRKTYTINKDMQVARVVTLKATIHGNVRAQEDVTVESLRNETIVETDCYI